MKIKKKQQQTKITAIQHNTLKQIFSSSFSWYAECWCTYACMSVCLYGCMYVLYGDGWILANIFGGKCHSVLLDAIIITTTTTAQRKISKMKTKTFKQTVLHATLSKHDTDKDGK